jgi:UDP-GlcNAc:undecaprenyl-phosphate/decaprenyl-phosphate GlcNAc-1-phosphate transferase
MQFSLPLTIAFAGVLALALALYLTPIVIAAALRYGITDKPKPPLKLHHNPVPYLGGMVVFLAFLASLAVTFPFDARVLAILLAASLVVAVGLIDDLGTLVPKDKFIGQLVAAVVLVKAGVSVQLQAVPSPGDEILSVLWLVTCMNAFNIIDVSDGLAATAGFVGSLGAGVVAVLNGEPMIATMAASLAGSCLGFLWYNRQPARIYLGDTGSMFLGAVLGALAMIGRYSETNSVSSFFVPLALMGIPFFDLVLVVVARLHARRAIYHGSPDHFAVRLRHRGWSARRIAWSAGAVALAVCAVSISTMFLRDALALAVFGTTVAALVTLLVVLLVRVRPKQPVAEAPPSAPGATPGAATAPAADGAPT